MSDTLTLPQSLVLLALRDEDGKFMGSWQKLVFAGAILSELNLKGRLSLSGRKGNLATVIDASPTGSIALDDALNTIACAPRQRSLKSWVNKLGCRSHSQNLLLQELVEMGALTKEKQKVLLVFNTTRWPEANGYYEERLRSEMAQAMFTEGAHVSERIGTTINLANQAHLLKRNFDRDRLREHKKRIKSITSQATFACPATKAAIDAVQAAVVAAAAASTVVAAG